MDTVYTMVNEHSLDVKEYTEEDTRTHTHRHTRAAGQTDGRTDAPLQMLIRSGVVSSPKNGGGQTFQQQRGPYSTSISFLSLIQKAVPVIVNNQIDVENVGRRGGLKNGKEKERGELYRVREMKTVRQFPMILMQHRLTSTHEFIEFISRALKFTHGKTKRKETYSPPSRRVRPFEKILAFESIS